ncbi:FixH family protein [Bradyrhizobium lablabi]|uniref:FixH family protein n=1 Tax=Bradyrhizobium lablabi TaxID=722472 RepID=UPI001BA759AB|nr:FixH family protein [Bradyrhizobium lablabi]MBR1121198.1 FixH family protein [Bradyrhizobium lablabi]
MNTFNFAHAVRAALVIAAFAGASTPAMADIKDYRFELVGETIAVGPDKVITVRLVNTKTGKPVPDAVIFATRLDMAPDAMQEMATKVTPLPGGEPGTYKFKAAFSMAGRWQLSLGAKVQGETGTVDNKLVITAQK